MADCTATAFSLKASYDCPPSPSDFLYKSALTSLRTSQEINDPNFEREGGAAALSLKIGIVLSLEAPESEAPQTKEVWYYDFRTNVHFTLRKNPLQYRDLQDFVNCYNSKYRSKHPSVWSSKKSDGRWRKFAYDELVARDKTSLDIFWLRDESLYDLDNPPEPDVLAAEIIENLEAGLNSFREILNGLGGEDAE